MAIRARTETGVMDANVLRLKVAGGTKRVLKVKVRTGLLPEELNTVFIGSDPLTAVIDGNTFLFAFSSTVSGSFTAIPSGGVGPFTYLWSIVSSEGSAPVIGSPTNATTLFSKSGIPENITQTANIRVVVTDSVGGSVTVNATLMFEHITLD